MADAVTVGLGSLMIALERPRELVMWNVVQLVTFAALVLVLAPSGITALAVGVAGFGMFNVLAIQLGLLRPYAGLGLRLLWSHIRAGCAAGVAAIATTVGLRLALEGSLSSLALLVLLGVTALAAVWLVLRLLFPAEEADIRRIVRRGH